MATSSVIGFVFFLLIIVFQNQLAMIFTSSTPVLEQVDKLSFLLAITILLNSVQPVLSGELLDIFYKLILHELFLPMQGQNCFQLESSDFISRSTFSSTDHNCALLGNDRIKACFFFLRCYFPKNLKHIFIFFSSAI